MNSGRSSRQSESSSEYSFVKAPKRKRLAKACDACHKSKRRCDGTAPCGNCYYTSKTCTYTDSSGRAVPAPRDKQAPTNDGTVAGSSGLGETWSHTAGSSSPALNDVDDDSGTDPKCSKRRRSVDFTGASNVEGVILSPAPGIYAGDLCGRSKRLLDDSLTWELVNLFFTHCNPYLLFIHRPSFFYALSSNTLPQYLLYAVCALGAPISRQARLRTDPSRLAGKDFGQEALSLMFDGAGRLICPRNLETVQALCLIRVHAVRLRAHDPKYHDLAIQMLGTLGLHDQVDESTLLSKATLERECMRRVFWHIYNTNLRDSMYAGMPVMFKEAELTMRMPVDEATFQFALSSLPPPEYLQSPPPANGRASEFAYFIRIVRLKNNIEHILNPQLNRDPEVDPFSALGVCDRGVMGWETALPEALLYNADNVQVQVSMLETGASTLAWLFFGMHLYHASAALALNCAKQPVPSSRAEPRWAEARIENILEVLGPRAKHTYLLPVAIWSLRRYCNVDTTRINDLLAQVEDVWGINTIAQTEDTPMVPPSQPLIPPTSQSAFSPSPFPPATPQPLRYQQQHPIDSQLYSLGPRPPPSIHSLSNPSPRSILSPDKISTPPHPHRDSNTPLSYHSGPSTHETSFSPDIPTGSDPTDSAQLSLPSLKSSGLLNLDSWHRQGSPAMLMPLAFNDPPRPDANGGEYAQRQGGSNLGSYANGLPVGMPWLANEGR